MSDTHFKDVPMSEWGIGDEALLEHSGEQVTITGFDPDNSDIVYIKHKDGEPSTAFRSNLKPVPVAGAPIPQKIEEAAEALVEEVTELLAQNGIVEDPTPQPTWEQVLMIPTEGEIPYKVGEYAIDTAGLRKPIVKIMGVDGDKRLCLYPNPPYPAGYNELVALAELGPVPEGTEIPSAEHYRMPEPAAVTNEDALKWGFEQAAQIVADDKSKIAQLELDLAQAREEMAQSLTNAQSEIITLNALLEAERRAHNSTRNEAAEIANVNTFQSAMLKTAAETMGAQDREIERLKQAAVQSRLQVQRAKRDTKLINSMIRNAAELTDLRMMLEDLDTEGWEIAYESYGDCEYFARLTRAAQTRAYVPPLKASVEEPAPTPQPEATPAEDETTALVGSAWEDETPDLEEVPIVIADDPDDAEELPLPETEEEPELVPMGQGATLSPVANYLLAQSARSPRQTGASMLTRKQNNMQRRGKPGPQYADDAIPHEVLDDGKLLLGGRVVIDPTQMPVIGTMLQHGAKALLNGWDFQTEEKVKAAMAETRAKQLTFTMPRTLGLPASVNS